MFNMKLGVEALGALGAAWMPNVTLNFSVFSATCRQTVTRTSLAAAQQLEPLLYNYY